MARNLERDAVARRMRELVSFTAAAVSVAGLVGIVACDSRDEVRPPGNDARRVAPPAAATHETSSAAINEDLRPRVVVLGDSLTAGLGLSRDEAYPALLQRRLDEAGIRLRVVNAGVSGDTSAGGLRRLDWALDGDVRVLVLALGANDGLRGLPPAELRRNLAAVIERSRARGAEVILAGMEAPPNFGPAYTAAFRQAYRDVAAKHGAALIPFLLEGVAGLPDLNQGDGIHPTAAGAEKLAETVWSALRPIVKPND
jgi:acyl-CoA thioesterase-1